MALRSLKLDSKAKSNLHQLIQSSAFSSPRSCSSALKSFRMLLHSSPCVAFHTDTTSQCADHQPSLGAKRPFFTTSLLHSQNSVSLASSSDNIIQQKPLTFCGGHLDRCGNERRDDKWIEQALNSPNARFLLFDDLNPLMEIISTEQQAQTQVNETAACGSPISLQIKWLTSHSFPLSSINSFVFLGVEKTEGRDSTPYFAITGAHPYDHGDSDSSDAAAATFVRARAAAQQATSFDSALIAQGRAMLSWHQTHQFCSKCGAPSSAHEGGYMRQCSRDTCQSLHFPRTDPTVIMLVHDESHEHLLLARGVRHAEGMYSALAGFMEPGETIEEAVAREVYEEVNIPVDQVRYQMSQPWPFPSNLMIGCFAQAQPSSATSSFSSSCTSSLLIKPKFDAHEIHDAQWFTHQQVKHLHSNWRDTSTIHVPHPMSIAYQLVNTWLAHADSLHPK